MGIKKIYTCDGKGCDATREFGGSTRLEDLEPGGWLVESLVGGCAVYCPKCREEHDRFNNQKKLIQLRHQQLAQEEIQDLFEKGLPSFKKMKIIQVSPKEAEKILTRK